MSSSRPGPLLRTLLRLPSRLYDWNAGWLLGHRFLRLTHVGRRSGRRYRTVLEVLGIDPVTGEVMVLSGFGRNADWHRNLEAGDGTAEIEIGRSRFRARYRDLDTDQAAAVLEAYERRNRLLVPIVRRVLGRLLGRPYDGSDAARRDLVRTLPVVAFTPERARPDAGGPQASSAS